MKAMLQGIEEHLEQCSKSNILIKSWTAKPLSNITTNAMWRYFPLTEKYYFELNPSFVFDYRNIEDMLEYPYVQFRDGFLGLAYFFLMNPKPIDKSSTIFLVPKKFESLVPSFWKGRVLLYDFSVEDSSERDPSSAAYIYGQISPETFLVQNYEDRLEDIRVACTGDEFHFLTPFRNITYLNSYFNSIFTRNTMKVIHKKFGSDVNYEDNFVASNYTKIRKNDSFCSLDKSHFYIYDDFLFHFMCARGAKPIDKKNSDNGKPIKKISLSLFHNINLYELKKPTNFILEKKIEVKIRRIPVNLSSESFYYYCQILFKEYSQEYPL